VFVVKLWIQPRINTKKDPPMLGNRGASLTYPLTRMVLTPIVAPQFVEAIIATGGDFGRHR